MSRKLPGSAIVSGSITVEQISVGLNDTTNSAYAQANTARGVANDSYGQANAAYGQANAARSDANTTFATVNTTFGTVNTNYQAAYAQANTARDQANNARSDANTTFGTVNTSLGTINTNYQAAYAQANTARSDANATFATVNTTFGTINTNYQAAYAQANTARGTANDAYASANLAYAAANNSNLKLGGLVSGTLNVTQDLIVGGNIYLEGNTTYINVATYSIEDSLVYYASNNKLTDSVDIGFMGGKNTSGTYAHTGFVRDATDGKWKLFDGLPEEGHVGNVVNFANTYLATLAANVEANTLTVVNGVSGNVNFDSGTLFVDSAGNKVGVGTTSPVRALTVYEATDSHIILQNANYNGAINKGFDLVLSSGGDGQVWNYENANLQFGTNNTERLRIQNNGNVAIGTTTAARRLHVTTGASDIAAFSGANTGVVIQDNTSGLNQVELVGYRQDDASYNDILIRGAAVGIFINGTTGNVGIGTTTAGYVLSTSSSVHGQYSQHRQSSGTGVGQEMYYMFNDSSGAAVNYASIYAEIAANTAGSHTGKIALRTVTAGTLSTKLLVDQTGNVGIGTASPTNKLHVVGGSATIQDTNSFIITPNYGGTTGIPAGVLINSGNAANVTFIADAASGTANRGVNISAFSGSNWFRGLSYMNKSGTPDLLLQQDGGNVGIGTTSPGNRLVVGDTSGVSTASIVAVMTTGNLGNCIEFGHSNAAGYRSTLGTHYGSGQPFLAFHAEAGTNNNTFRTRGIAGSVITTNNGGALLFSRVTTASADNQSLTESMRIDASGNMYLGLTGNPSGWGSAIKYAIRQASASGYTGFVAFASGNDNAIAVGHDGTKGVIGVSYATGSYTPLTFQTGGTDRITIATDGSVGIGTTNPTGKLTISSTAGEVHRSIELIQTGGDTTALKVGYARFGSLDGSVYTDMLNNSWWDGGSWIADNASYAGMLYRAHNATTVGNAAYRWYISAPGGTHNYVEYMTLTTTGLLLGTAGSPGYKLDVRGSGTVAGFTSSTSTVGITIQHSGNGGTIGYTNNGAGDLANLFYITTGAATVGSGIVMDNSGRVGIATANPGSYRLYVQGDQYVSGTLTEGSSIALKENIDPITNALDVITKLVGVTYDRKDGSGKNRAGLIAEEVDQVLPNVVKKDENGNASGIQYTNLIAYLIESIKELKAEIDVLKSK